jgi:Na+/proline symporter
LLETAYAIGMVGLFVPLTLGLFTARGGAVAALASMGVGTLVWAAHLLLGWEGFGGPLLGDVYLPQELVATALSWVAFEAAALWERRRSIAATAQRGAC